MRWLGPTELPPTLFDFFASVLTHLLGVSAIARLVEGPETLAFGPSYGVLTAAIEYENASQLHLALAVDYNNRYPEWKHYSFHYQRRDGTLLFRFDNERGHQGLPFYPEHVHVGPDNHIRGRPMPSIREVCHHIEAAVRGTPSLE